jgi:hypothetical protein
MVWLLFMVVVITDSGTLKTSTTEIELVVESSTEIAMTAWENSSSGTTTATHTKHHSKHQKSRFGGRCVGDRYRHVQWKRIDVFPF